MAKGLSWMEKLRSSRYFKKMLVLFMLLLSVPVMCICIWGYYSMMHDHYVQRETTYSNALIDVASSIDRELGSLSTLTIQLGQLGWVNKYINASAVTHGYDEIDQLQLKSNIDDLTLFKATNSILDGIILCFEDKDLVISSYGRNRFDEFYTRRFVSEQRSAKGWSLLLNTLGYMEMLAPEKISIEQKETRLIPCVSTLPVRSRTIYAAIILTIDCEALEHWLANNQVFENSRLSIYTEDMIHVAGDKLPEETLEQIPAAANRTNLGKIKFKEESQSFTSFIFSSDVNGWLYIATLPKLLLYGGDFYMGRLILSAMLAYLLLASITAFTLAWHRAKPVEKLLAKANAANPANLDCQSDFAYLEETISKLAQGEQLSRYQVEAYKPFARNTVLTHLLYSELPSASMEGRLGETLGIYLDYRYFACMCISINRDVSLGERLYPALQEAFADEYISIYLCDMDKTLKTAIINLDNKAMLHEIADIIIDMIGQRNISVRAVGIGCAYETADSISLSYDEASFALNFRESGREMSVVFYEDILPENSHFLYLPDTGGILCALMAADAQTALEKADLQINSCGDLLSLSSIQHMYYTLAVLAMRALSEKRMSGAFKVDIGEILSQSTVDAMHMILKKAYEEACRLMGENSGANTHIIQEVLEQINECYMDKNISLSMLAERYSISASHLSRSFKSATNINFLDYLNRKRIEQAKKLI